MFSTFVEELEEDRPRYGIVKNLGTFNPLKVAFHEWIGMFRVAFAPGLTLRERLNYLIKPPGWSHDGRATRRRAGRRLMFGGIRGRRASRDCRRQASRPRNNIA